MSRSTTTNLSLGVWDQDDNPGAGSKVADSTGLNGNWIKIDTALGVAHTTAGAHKSDVIDGPNLKTSCADGTTINLTGSPLKLSVLAGGIGTTQLASLAVTTAKIAAANVTQAKMATDSVGTTQLIALNVTGAKVAANTLTYDKFAEDAATYFLYGDTRVAAITAAATPAAYTEWVETSATMVTKVSLYWNKRVGDQHVKCYAGLITGNASYVAQAKLSVDVLSTTDSSADTVYDTASGYDVALSLDVSSLTAGLTYEVTLSLANVKGVGVNASMRYPVILVTKY